MKLLLSLFIFAELVQPLPRPQSAPVNEVEIDRALNAGRTPPAPIYEMPDIPGSEPSPLAPEEKPEKPADDTHPQDAPKPPTPQPAVDPPAEKPKPTPAFNDPSNLTPEEMDKLHAALQPGAASTSTTPPPASATPEEKPPPPDQMAHDDAKGYGQNQAQKDNTCVIFDPPDRIATSKMCVNVCGLVVQKQLEVDRSGSTACIGSSPPGKDPWVVEEGMILTLE